MSRQTRNADRQRPDAALRWAGRLIFLTALLIITDLALQPGQGQASRLMGVDKLEHFAAFAVLAILARTGWPRLFLPLLLPVLLVYGAGLELAQAAVGEGRTASVADFAADGLGLAFGLIATTFLPRRAARG